MARPTRQARRQRREQARADGAGGAPPRNRPPAAVAQAEPERPAPQGPVQPEAAPRKRGSRVGGINFIAECWAELKKVEWPTQRQVMTGTVVVIIACTIVGTYL